MKRARDSRWVYFPGSLFFLLFLVLSSVIMSVMAPFTKPLPFRMRYAFISQWAHMNLWVTRWACGIRMRVRRRDHGHKGAAIVLCKHQSAWETLAMQALFPDQVLVMKQEVLRLPFFGWGLSILEPIAIDRDAGFKALKQLVNQGMERLNRGLWVMIFPEGTRTLPGERGRYNVGGAMLAVKAAEQGIPVIPMAHNAGLFWPKNSFWKYPGTVDVVIGEPKDVSGMKAAEVKAWMEEWIEGEAQKLPATTVVG